MAKKLDIELNCALIGQLFLKSAWADMICTNYANSKYPDKEKTHYKGKSRCNVSVKVDKKQ